MQTQTDEMTISLKKTHLVIVCIVSVMMPAASAVTSYMKSQAEIQKEIFASRMESEQRYVKQSSVEKMIDRLDVMNERLSNIEGYLEKKSQK